MVDNFTKHLLRHYLKDVVEIDEEDIHKDTIIELIKWMEEDLV